jgi:hypothetical protein
MNQIIYEHNFFNYITIATRPSRILDKIREKIIKNNETIIVLGEKENRIIGWENKQNFGLKLSLVKQFLDSNEMLPNNIVLFTDAYDVIYCGNQKEIVEKYLSFHTPIVFGSEKYCNPDPHREKQYLKKDSEFPFLNSGLYIGRAWALKNCLKNYEYNDDDDDQRFWTTQLFENPDLISLDYSNELFLNTVGIDMQYFMWDKEKHMAMYKDKIPQFIHINGPDKSLLEKLLF